MKKFTSKVVVGLGFGDCGKGLTTSYLCSKVENPIVVRFNGGHQAGHTVHYKGKRHVFSNFGSGTLQDVPTFWSKNCTFSPIGFVSERALLDNPLFFIDPLCPVTTPLDKLINQQRDSKLKHGTIGVGFGTTVERHENNCKFYVQDLFYGSVLDEKIKMVENYYKLKFGDDLKPFISAIKEARKHINLCYDKILLERHTPIFEGAQGIMLDKDFGFFPHVTRSNTTTKLAHELWSIDEVYYITRSYQTRHGNGPMAKPGTLKLKNTQDETNKPNKFQGEFRTAPLDVDMLNHALLCDDNYSSECSKNLVVTCMDQHEIDVDMLLKQLDTEFDHVYVSDGPSLSHIKLYK